MFLRRLACMPEVIKKLAAEIRTTLDTPDAKQRAQTAGIGIRFAGPEALAKMVKDETDYWSRIIRSRKIAAD